MDDITNDEGSHVLNESIDNATRCVLRSKSAVIMSQNNIINIRISRTTFAWDTVQVFDPRIGFRRQRYNV